MKVNRVLSGDYRGWSVGVRRSGIVLSDGPRFKRINKTTVKDVQILESDHRLDSKSALIRGGIGVLLLGRWGLLAGLTARTQGSYLLELTFQPEEDTPPAKSLLMVDDVVYKQLLQDLL